MSEKKKRGRMCLNKKGFTLIEVMVAFAILLIASQIIVLGAAFSVKMRARAEEKEMVRREIGLHLLEKTDCMSGTVRLNIGEDLWELEAKGWLYPGNEEVPLDIIWVEE